MSERPRQWAVSSRSPLLTVEGELHFGVDDAVRAEPLPEPLEPAGEGGVQVGVHCQTLDAASQAERRTGGPALTIAGEGEVGGADFAGELFDDEFRRESA